MSDYEMDTTDLFILSKIRNISFQQITIDILKSKPSLEEYKSLISIKSRINQGYPLAYILGKIEFIDREFNLSDKVLVPRPETEEWTKSLIQELSQYKFSKNLTNKINLVDLACGSGVIGLSMWLELGPILESVHLIDLSSDALNVSKVNYQNFSRTYSSRTNVNFVESDLFSDMDKSFITTLKSESEFNILLANLPYLPINDKYNPDLNIKFEPEMALYSGDDGLDLFKKVLDQIYKLELKFKILCFELDPRNIFRAQSLACSYQNLNQYKCSVKTDFMGKPRLLRFDIL